MIIISNFSRCRSGHTLNFYYAIDKRSDTFQNSANTNHRRAFTLCGNYFLSVIIYDTIYPEKNACMK